MDLFKKSDNIFEKLTNLLAGKPIKPVNKKWQYAIKCWLGKARKGIWVPESVATNFYREYEHHTHGKDSTPQKPIIVKETVREMVYAHHGYRPKFEDEKGTRKSFYFRGARIWRS